MMDVIKKHKAAATLSIKPCYRNTIFATTKKHLQENTKDTKIKYIWQSLRLYDGSNGEM